MTINEALRDASKELIENKIDDAYLKVRMALAYLLDKDKEYLVIHGEDELDEKSLRVFMKNVDKLSKGVPIQYIVKKQSFMGMDLYVNEDVLIPQPDTEAVIEEVLKLAEVINKRKNPSETIKILDMCTGSGAIAISLAKYIYQSEVYASDISPKALEVAEYNAKTQGFDIKLIKSNLFEKIDVNEKFDIIVSNPPYIESEIIDKLPIEVQNEPRLALDGGLDGLSFYRNISIDAKDNLKDDGYLVFEIGYNQKYDVIRIMQDNGYRNIEAKKDLSLNDRIIIGQK